MGPVLERALSELVDRRYHDAFRRFVQTGELNPEFEKYLNTDEKGQRAVDMVAEAQFDALRAAGDALRRAPDEPAPEMVPLTETAAGAMAIAKGLELVVSGAAQVTRRDAAAGAESAVVRQLDEALKAQRVDVPEQQARLTQIVEFASQVAAQAANQAVGLQRAVLGMSR